MKHKNLIMGALLSICAGLLFAALIKHAIVPNDVVLKNSTDYDTTWIYTPIDSNLINFYTLRVEPNYIRAELDTNNVLTIYDPQITVKYDTLK